MGKLYSNDINANFFQTHNVFLFVLLEIELSIPRVKMALISIHSGHLSFQNGYVHRKRRG
jgi:hypothetical protein